MENSNDIVWVLILTITGILYYESLSRLEKAVRKIFKILYLILVITSGVLITEAVMRITLDSRIVVIQKLIEVLVRIIQSGFIVIGFVMLLQIIFTKPRQID